MPEKPGTAQWTGDVPTGSGTFTAGDTISGGYTYKSRFEGGPGSDPEQVITAAHAACFSTARTLVLAPAGSPPDFARTALTVTSRPVDGVPTITKIALVTAGEGARHRRGCVRRARHHREGRLSRQQCTSRCTRESSSCFPRTLIEKDIS
jgi:osmotically inducible protein OsmC